MTTIRNGLPVEARESLERVMIELVGIAARPEPDPAVREDLMRLADQISVVLETE
jgi:hypothetical protein